MNVAEIVEATRRGVGLFPMDERGLLEVRGEDRVRWLDGMISGDVQALDTQGEGAGCYATLLTNRGAVIADLHVGNFGESFLLESKRSEIGRIKETLERFIVADDVTLEDRSDELVGLALEGPGVGELLSALPGLPAPPAERAPERWGRARIADREVYWAAFGFSGESALQLWMDSGSREAVVEALVGAGEGVGLCRGNPAALEVLRIEAGIPALGTELDEEVMPAEARLERAISTDKGCYVGQEIVARLRARGRVNHLLVGLRVEPGSALAEGTPLRSGDRETGEVTSVADSPSEGRIALGYVRREHSEPGTVVRFEGGSARVAALPLRALGACATDPR